MSKRQSGFTLIELVMMISILGVLAATALPSFIVLSKEARIAAIAQIKIAATIANNFMYLKSQMSSYSTQIVNNRVDLLDVDTNGDGVFDTRLKWNYLDNTDIETRVDLSADFSIEYESIHTTYIGYDNNDDGNVQSDNCYFKYTQATDVHTPPIYDLISSGC